MTDKSFERIGRRFEQQTTLTPSTKGMCAEAAEFKAKMEMGIFSVLGTAPTREQLMQGKYLLQEEWHDWRKGLPDFHPRSSIPGLKHPCIDDVYFSSYERLRLLGMRLQLNALTPKPPEPKLPTLSIPKDFSFSVSPNDIVLGPQPPDEDRS